MAILCLLLPINAPVEYWGEDMLSSLMILGLFRIPITLHAVWFINSARIIWELKPNDRYAKSTIQKLFDINSLHLIN